MPITVGQSRQHYDDPFLNCDGNNVGKSSSLGKARACIDRDFDDDLHHFAGFRSQTLNQRPQLWHGFVREKVFIHNFLRAAK